jgi:RNA recognition motif-containing protein
MLDIAIHYFHVNCTDKQRGFAFVEFESEEDAADALENMDGSELFGKVIRCNIAKAVPKLAAGKAVWNSEDWIQSNLQDDVGEEERVPEVTLIPSKMDDEEEEIQ